MTQSDFDRSMVIVEDALRTMPLTPAPAAIRSGVMVRVRALSAAPKFEFPWLEGAISLMLSTLLTGVVSLFLGLPPTTLQRLQHSVRFFFILPANRPLIAAAVIGLGMLAVCLLCAVQILRQGRRAPAVYRR
jgi:hypothetical protein